MLITKLNIKVCHLLSTLTLFSTWGFFTQAQVTSDPVTNLLIIIVATFVIDGIVLFYVYKKNKSGLGFKIAFLVLLSAFIPNISSSVSPIFGSNGLEVQAIWGVLSIAVVLITIFYILNTIIAPINTLVVASETIASGKLTTELPIIRSKDETYRLRNSFEKMDNFLKSIVSDLKSSTQIMTSSSNNLASASEEVNASSEEISSITQKISQSTNEQNQKLNDLVQISNNLKLTFDTKIQEINSASTLIENISAQVNMLSLNASIESARAGEYGRGFTVVAENIRKLADDSKNSVQQVQTTIESLRHETTNSLSNLINSVNSLAILASDTASGSEEASAATEEQSATIQEITASAQELANLSNNLEQLLIQFSF